MFQLKDIKLSREEFLNYYRLYYATILKQKGSVTPSDYISKLSVDSFKNIQKVIIGSIELFPSTWIII